MFDSECGPCSFNNGNSTALNSTPIPSQPNVPTLCNLSFPAPTPRVQLSISFPPFTDPIFTQRRRTQLILFGRKGRKNWRATNDQNRTPTFQDDLLSHCPFKPPQPSPWQQNINANHPKAPRRSSFQRIPAALLWLEEEELVDD